MNAQTLSAHVLSAIANAQREGRLANLETITQNLGVRRTDVRKIVSALHREGIIDAARMRLTLRGFALAHAIAAHDLAPLRPERAPSRTTLAA
jgi:Mn-dependent DtxR family transcriptional regulator